MKGFQHEGFDQIIDLYTIEDGRIFHVASSGASYWWLENPYWWVYQLCEDGTIYYWSSLNWDSNIWDSSPRVYYTHYQLVDGKYELGVDERATIERVWSDIDSSNGVHWYHSTTTTDEAVEISEAQVSEITGRWPKRVNLTLTPFSEYRS